MGPANDAAASPHPSPLHGEGAEGEAGPKEAYVTLMRPTCTKTRQDGVMRCHGKACLSCSLALLYRYTSVRMIDVWARDGQ